MKMEKIVNVANILRKFGNTALNGLNYHIRRCFRNGKLNFFII
jgi:hypothetical protein